jgi:HAD superfamily hydrolase (TIGR01509 family)
MVKAILWDNDGVLVDTERLFFQSCQETLAKIGIALSLEHFLELTMRQGRSAFQLAAERGWQAERIGDLKCERDQLYTEMLRKNTRVMAGIPGTLKALHRRIRMVVVTSSQRQHFDVMHADTQLIEFFEFVLAREDFKQTKPNPEPYLLAVAQLGIKAEHCVAIEDSERGLAAARAAGLRCLVIPNHMTRNCNFQGATAVLPDATAVLSALAAL